MGDHKQVYFYKSGPASQIYLARYLLSKNKNVVLLVPPSKNLSLYNALSGIFSNFKRDKDKFWESSWNILPDVSIRRKEGWNSLWPGLFSLINNKPAVSIIPSNLILHYFPPRKVVENSYLLLVPHEDFSPERILTQAIAWGYERRASVSQSSEIVSRGDILDIFPPGYSYPVRMEFFGDRIESIRTFDPLTQRSLIELDECLIMPAAPCLFDEELKTQAEQKLFHLKTISEVSPAVYHLLREKLSLQQQNYPVGMYYETPSTLADFIAEDTFFLLTDLNEIRTGLEEEEWKFRCIAEEREYPQNYFFQTQSRSRTIWQNKPQLMFEKLIIGQKQHGLDLPEKDYRAFSDIFWKPEHGKRPWHTLVEAIKEWRRTAHQVILAFNTHKSREKFLNIISQDGLRFETEYDPDRRGLYALVAPLGRGMSLEWNHIVILGEDVIQPLKSDRGRAVQGKFAGLSGLDDIAQGDLLIHRDYGLGRFHGLQRVSAGRSANDFLIIEYANDDKLYLPVDRFSLVQKYKGPEGISPALDRLGGTGWSKTKARVRKAIEKIAKDLVDMYAYRKVAKGYSYGPEGELYREFEATFGFDETPDQEQAIKQVMEDMEKPEPMDRLVCGDVGFGKTEVAMRAAFRAVQDGKQVAILCPTTVLAEQHYLNFRKRMEDLSVNVSMLSRFVTQARQKNILNAARRGEVDILIGTHRILSKDVILPNISLLILDEEQRFGVKHKEKLKRFRQNIDVLALTATPIPRTLQLSISGIRTLSLIETPPVDRKPVESSIIEKDRDFLQQVIQRELDRQGQIFWVYNRIRGLDEVSRYVREIAPEARVGMAHGRMPERLLEETMHRFWRHELDILVCTAIIESGLDFPRANTLIVDQAQLFGLGQLYQLRGRVGRSEKQAYAYFIVPEDDSLNDKARKRMQIILDLDYLGAGFQVAMEDLRLRGAGNLLGEVQSGQIGKVGLDLFLDMLQEEVAKQKGDPVQAKGDFETSIGFPAFIPEKYIPDSQERLRYYRVLSACSDLAGISDVRQEIKDIYGNLPQELDSFLSVLEAKQIIKNLNPDKVEFQENRFAVEWSENNQQLNPVKLVQWVEKHSDTARLVPPSKLELRLSNNESINNNLKQLRKMVESMVNEML
ncbi:MAG: transcription-repair coupling factor [Desulfonatronovibrio sp. MSAO_Bac4]|nr:MAG: transcription-repair coupling factor [Desulfonatronovibrio sp. MSAO_Bac4]